MNKLVALALISTLGFGCGGDGGSSGDGGNGGNPDAAPQSDAGPQTMANCSDFPATIPTGETISPDSTGAVLCDPDNAEFCRVDNNTYSEACGGEQEVYFAVVGGANPDRTIYLRDQATWELTDLSHGTIIEGYTATGIPDATQVTAGITKGGTTYDVVFEFQGTNIHFISVAPR